MKTLKQFFDSCYEEFINKNDLYIRKDQLILYAICENILINIRVIKNKSFKQEIIDYSIENKSNLAIGMLMNKMFNHTDDETQQKWHYIEDYELIGFSGDMPIIERKNKK